MSIAERSSEFSWPRVAASFDFKRPLRFEDESDVHIKVAEKKSKTIRYSAELKKDGEVLAVGSLTIICARRTPGQPLRACDIPPRYQRTLRRRGLRTVNRMVVGELVNQWSW